MSIANVTLSDTFAEWVNKTNQLIVQSQNNYTLSVSSFNAVNAASFTAANITADVLSTNNTFVVNISNQLISSGNLMNAVLSNTIITNTIYDNANTIATSFNANSNLGLAWNTANSAYEKANTANTTADLAFGQANTARNHANVSFGQANTARDHANVAFGKANTAVANTDSYTLVINNLTITGNLILSGPDAVLNML